MRVVVTKDVGFDVYEEGWQGLSLSEQADFLELLYSENELCWFLKANIAEIISEYGNIEAAIEIIEKRVIEGQDDLQPHLDPCPHCLKGRAALEHVSNYTDDRTGLHDDDKATGLIQWQIICNAQRGGCGASGGFASTISNAVAHWNLA